MISASPGWKSLNKGKLAEIVFQAKCVRLGWQHCTPSIDQWGYDAVIDRGRGFESVQVKSTQWRTQKRSNRNSNRYQNNRFEPTLKIKKPLRDVNLVAVVEVSLDTIWLIPRSMFSNADMQRKSLTKKYDKYIIWGSPIETQNHIPSDQIAGLLPGQERTATYRESESDQSFLWVSIDE